MCREGGFGRLFCLFRASQVRALPGGLLVEWMLYCAALADGRRDPGCQRCCARCVFTGKSLDYKRMTWLQGREHGVPGLNLPDICPIPVWETATRKPHP